MLQRLRLLGGPQLRRHDSGAIDVGGDPQRCDGQLAALAAPTVQVVQPERKVFAGESLLACGLWMELNW